MRTVESGGTWLFLRLRESNTIYIVLHLRFYFCAKKEESVSLSSFFSFCQYLVLIAAVAVIAVFVVGIVFRRVLVAVLLRFIL